jgi:hypothetical protein
MVCIWRTEEDFWYASIGPDQVLHQAMHMFMQKHRHSELNSQKSFVRD